MNLIWWHNKWERPQESYKPRKDETKLHHYNVQKKYKKNGLSRKPMCHDNGSRQVLDTSVSKDSTMQSYPRGSNYKHNVITRVITRSSLETIIK